MVNTLTEVLPYAATHYGDKVAVHIDGEQFTFRRLDELASQVANGLHELGVGKADIVTLYSENRWEWIVSYYGVLKAGAVVNPINVMLTPSEVDFVVRDCGAKVLLASGEKGGSILGLARGDDPVSIVLFDAGAVTDGAIGFADLVAGQQTTFESPEVEPTELASICYTSGTTGHPKGAMQSHQAVLLNAAMTAQVHTRTASDVAINALPLPHVYGSVILNSTMLMGSTLVVHKRFVPDDILRDLEKYSATTFDGVPTMYMYLLNHPDLDTTNLSALRKCFVGGQTMPVAKMKEVEARFGAPIMELWGMTELAGLGTAIPLNGRNRHGSIGLVLPYAEVRIADVEDASVTMPRGQVGELMVRGPLVMLGYFGNEDATVETIEADGWMHTGDLASMDVDGYVFIVDRKKDMILTGGSTSTPLRSSG